MTSHMTAASPKATEPLSPEGLRDLLAHLLAGAIGGDEPTWRGLVGDVEALPIVFPRSNWRIDPSGTAAEREAIAKAEQLVREAHPYVSKQASDGR
jgi:hypothetical protein